MRRKIIIAMAVSLFLFPIPLYAGGGDLSAIKAEIEAMKGRLKTLENQLIKQQQLIEKQNQLIEAYEKALKKQETELEAQKKDMAKQKETLEAQSKDVKAMSALRAVLSHMEFSGDVTGILQGTSNMDEGNSTDGTFTFDFGIATHFGGYGSFYVHLEGGDGEGLNNNVPSFSVPNYDAYATLNNANETDLTISEAYYEFSLFKEKVTLNVGKMDVSVLFDENEAAGDETTQFLSNIFVKSMGLTIPEPDNFYCPAMMVKIDPIDLIELRFVGASVEDNDWEDIFDHGFGAAQINFRPKIKGRQGNYRFYTWIDGRNHMKNSNLSLATDSYKDPRADKNQTGFGVSFDQELNDNLIAFFRYSYTNDNLATWSDDHWEMIPFNQVWSTGLQISGAWWKRKDDAVGLAYGQTILTSDYKRANDHTSDEQYIETYYRWQLHERFGLTGDFQWIKNAGGNSKASDIYIFGLRSQLDF
jgi:hypothetical protein